MIESSMEEASDEEVPNFATLTTMAIPPAIPTTTASASATTDSPFMATSTPKIPAKNFYTKRRIIPAVLAPKTTAVPPPRVVVIQKPKAPGPSTAQPNQSQPGTSKIFTSIRPQRKITLDQALKRFNYFNGSDVEDDSDEEFHGPESESSESAQSEPEEVEPEPVKKAKKGSKAPVEPPKLWSKDPAIPATFPIPKSAWHYSGYG